MERYAWHGKLIGDPAEYKRRHDEIWADMVAVLKGAGICNYTVYLDGTDLFGYYECKYGVAYAARVQAESEVVRRWNEYMADILELPADPVTGAQPHLTEMFRLD